MVYAVGYDNYVDFTYTAVGGDDFAEYISLNDEHHGVTLIELIRHHAARGGILIVYPRTYDISFSSAISPFDR